MNKFVKLVLCIMVLSVLLGAPQSVSAKAEKGINIKKTFSKAIGEEMSRQKYDKNQDGYLSGKEIKQIKSFYLCSDVVKENVNVKGISKLKYLEKIRINICGHAYNIKEVEKLHKLKYTSILFEPKKKIVLNLKKCRDIKTLGLYTSGGKAQVKVKIRANNKIRNLYVSGVENGVALIRKCAKVQDLYLDNNAKKTKININNKKAISKISLTDSDNIESVNVQGCNNLKEISLENVKGMKSFQVRQCKILPQIEVDGGKIGESTIKDCPNIKKIIFDNTKGLSKVSISGLPKLKIIDIQDTPKLKSLILENLPKLKELSCVRGALSELNILGENQISEINVYKNKLKKFEYENLKKLNYLDCDDNQIEGKFDFTLYPKLYNLFCRNNKLTEIYGGDGNREIEMIDCYNNNLKLIDFNAMYSGEGFIWSLNCKKNPNVEVKAVIERCKRDSTAKIESM